MRPDQLTDKQLKEFLGTFFEQNLPQEFIDAILSGKLHLSEEILDDLLKVKESVNWEQADAPDTASVYPLIIRRQDRQKLPAYLFGDQIYFGDQTRHFGGEADHFFSYPIPENLAGFSIITDAIKSPKKSWTNGSSVILDSKNRQLVFFEDPLSQGEAERVLWLHDSEFYKTQKQSSLQALVPVNLKESPRPAAKPTTALLRSFINDITENQLYEIFSYFTGIPFSKNHEIIEEINQTPDGTVIVTKTESYTVPTNSRQLAAGNFVNAGQFLNRVLKQIIFANNNVIPEDDFDCLTLSEEELADDIGGEITLQNKNVPCQVEDVVDGIPKIKFQVGGWPHVIENFFNKIHELGVMSGLPIAALLDTRANPTGYPTKEQIRDQINPLLFYLNNLLAQTTQIYQLNVADFKKLPGAEAVLNAINKATPPHGKLILVIKMPEHQETAEMSGAGTDNSTGFSENYEIFIAT